MFINIHEIIYDSFMNIGPSEFLYLVHHAFLIMTDSFHASVFSFIFEKPFLLFARSGMCMLFFEFVSTIYDIVDGW